jgi:predicted dehydrogenase
MKRKEFIKTSMLASAGFTLPIRSYSNVKGANDQIRVGIVGVGSNIKIGGKGKQEIREYLNMPGIKIAALCDCDSDILRKEENEFKKRNEPVKTYSDFRKLLEDKEIDVINITTPNHTHALITIMACQAGKDVFCQKPASHNIWEGRKMVEAAEKYKRIVQIPSNSRGSDLLFQAGEYARAGNLGKLLYIYGANYKPRMSIGRVNGVQEVPKSVDYDLWCGPAPKKPLKREYLHYDWHWDWDTGNGDIGNMGIHYMDGCRMALGVDTLPRQVLSLGGRFGYEDDGFTPNTQLIYLDYEPAPIIFEVKGLPSDSIFMRANWEVNSKWSMDKRYGVDLGVIIYCENGLIIGNSAYDYSGKVIKQFTPKGQNNRSNFIEAVKSRDVKSQNAHILDGHLSAALGHLGNISYRVGKNVSNGEIKERIKGIKSLEDSFDRFDNHLYSNRIDLKKSPIKLGPLLQFNPKEEKFSGDFSNEANLLLTREYRKPYVIPEKI